MFVDSHAHLDSPVLQSDLEGVLARARQAEVESILTICCVEEDRRSVGTTLDLLDRYDFVRAAFGVHPHDARFFSDGIAAELSDLLRHPKALALGEIGLDYHYLNSGVDAQREAFAAQIELAQAAGKPIVIHSRKAEDEICSMLEEKYPSGAGLNGVVHCFTSDEPTARRCLDRGFFIGLGGILTFRKSDSLRAVASRLPLDRILIETDSPYLSPVPYRGRTNEPSRVVEVARELARIRALTPQQVGERTRSNFERLFGPRSLGAPGRLPVSNCR